MKKLLVAMLLLAAVGASAQTIPAGTAIRVRLQTTLTSFGNKSGDTFTGQVTDTMTSSGMNMLPAGTILQGRVTKVSEPRRIKGRPTIGILPESLTLATGEKLPLTEKVTENLSITTKREAMIRPTAICTPLPPRIFLVPIIAPIRVMMMMEKGVASRWYLSSL